MGEVYLAVQESLHRPVALKVLSAKLDADPAFVERFLIEARAAAALSHPNVVVVHDVGEADGHHYLAMEYMDRGSLEDRVSQGPLPWREVLDVLHDAARGLMYAEEKGIVHRDVKPANLMRNSAGATKIADLGLATSSGSTAGDTGGRKIFGTPHFIAPEQARGETVDHRADLYSLGATAYRLLSGRTPFEGESTRDILRGHFQDEPTPIGELVDLPGELATLVHRLLAKAPDARPASARVLLEAVDRLRAHADHGVAAGSGSKGWVVGAAALVVAAGIGYGLFAGGVFGGGEEPGPVGPTGPAVAGTGGMPTLDGDGDGDGGKGDGDANSEPDEDHLIQVRELEAQLEYKDLDRVQDRAARVVALRAFAAEFEGTTQATEAAQEADGLESELRAEEEAEEARATALAAAVSALRSETGLDGPVAPSAGDALANLLQAAAPADVDAQAYEAARGQLESEVVARALEDARAAMDEVELAAAAGDFDRVRALLEGLALELNVPDYAEGRAPQGAGELAALGASARDRLLGLEAEEVAFGKRAELEAARALAAGIGAGSGFGGELLELRLGDARARLDALIAQLGEGTTAGQRAAALRADVAAAEGALEDLAEAFHAGEWRRKAVIDPRDGNAHEATGADAQGLVLDGKDAPWAVFGGDPDALDGLFDGRLGRDYTEDELAGIAVLLRIAGVGRLVAATGAALGPDGPSFDADDAAALAGALDPALDWAARSGRAELVTAAEAEHASASLATDALVAAAEGAWSRSVARLEELLGEHTRSLLVQLLSDGSDWQQAPPEPPAVTDPPPVDDENGGEEAGEVEGDAEDGDASMEERGDTGPGEPGPGGAGPGEGPDPAGSGG